MHDKKLEDHSKDATINRAAIWIFAVIAVLIILVVVLLGLLLEFPWQLILGMTLSVPLLIVPAILGYKHGRRMYK